MFLLYSLWYNYFTKNFKWRTFYVSNKTNPKNNCFYTLCIAASKHGIECSDLGGAHRLSFMNYFAKKGFQLTQNEQPETKSNLENLVTYLRLIRIAFGIDNYKLDSHYMFKEIKHEPDAEKRKTAYAEIQKMEREYFLIEDDLASSCDDTTTASNTNGLG